MWNSYPTNRGLVRYLLIFSPMLLNSHSKGISRLELAMFNSIITKTKKMNLTMRIIKNKDLTRSYLRLKIQV
jgi:hypothetical protein